jgi:YVTN family beta-propeller protein
MMIRTLGCSAVVFLALIATPAARAAPFAYITISAANEVWVIDTATNTVTAKIPVGAKPAGVAVAPNGKRVYVANIMAGTVSEIETATNTVTATISVGALSGFGGLAVSPDSAHVYAAAAGSGGSLSVIDVATGSVTHILGIGASPNGIAVTPNGTRLYVTHSCAGCTTPSNVTVIDTATGTVATTISAGSNGMGVAVAPDGAHVYVANRENNTVSVIATTNNAVTATITVGHAPIGVAVSPDSHTVYVTNEHMNAGVYGITVIDAGTNAVKTTVPVGNTPEGVDVTPDGAHVYVANLDTANVSVITAATNTVTATVAVGTRPIAFGKFITPVATEPPSTPPPTGIVVSPHDFPYKVTFQTKCTSSVAGVCLRRDVVRVCVGGNCFDVPPRTTGPICVRCWVGVGVLGGAAVGALGTGAVFYGRRRRDGPP